MQVFTTEEHPYLKLKPVNLTSPRKESCYISYFLSKLLSLLNKLDLLSAELLVMPKERILGTLSFRHSKMGKIGYGLT
jgi:hypothetical protein